MIKRYEAVVMAWSGRDGCWHPRSLGCYGTRERAERRLLRVVRSYTRYERHPDFAEVVDRKTGRSTDASMTVYESPTVGDLGWTP